MNDTTIHKVQHALSTITLAAAFLLFVYDTNVYTCAFLCIFSVLFFIYRTFLDYYSKYVSIHNYKKEIEEMKRIVNENSDQLLKKQIELELKVNQLNMTIPKSLESLSDFTR